MRGQPWPTDSGLRRRNDLDRAHSTLANYRSGVQDLGDERSPSVPTWWCSTQPHDACSRPTVIAEETVSNNAYLRSEGGVLQHVVIHVRPAYRPRRWAWYAVDTENGQIVEYAFEYDSPLAARRAGLERLDEVASYLGMVRDGAARASRLRSLPPSGHDGRRLNFPILTTLAEEAR